MFSFFFCYLIWFMRFHIILHKILNMFYFDIQIFCLFCDIKIYIVFYFYFYFTAIHAYKYSVFDSNIDSLQLLSVWDTLNFIWYFDKEIWNWIYIVKTVCVVLFNVCLVLPTGENTENKIKKSSMREKCK